MRRLLALAISGLLCTPACGAAGIRTDYAELSAIPFDQELSEKLQDTWSRRPAGYKPRTRHLRPDGTPRFTNRLFLESSPYLRQHAHNPVNWYPWGDEAFETARRLGRPVLLSVGYSTCHWCHVMEEESFEDIEIARYLNEHYVAIKVDREERPDVDAVYMAAVQALTGRGGWPMTVWLTPDRKPFHGGTYFPPRDGERGVSNGFLTLLRGLQRAYAERAADVARNAQALTDAVRESLATAPGEALPDAAAMHKAARLYEAGFDQQHGGRRGAPKFPSSLPLRFLLRYHRRTGNERFQRMAELTLERMARGGMYDHVGGGFHRYSTDEQWLVPHFEKMLYDNALLTVAYLEGYQATGREDFAGVAREILRYVERDMTSPEGAFYSATDADSTNPHKSEREEGWFFTWTPEEIGNALGAERARAVAAWYGVTKAGNFEGRSILHTPRTLAEVAQELKTAPEELRATIAEAREKLYQVRAKRPPPLRDEKILTSWNGLMISAHAFAALVLDDAQYAARAERAADFLLRKLQQDGRLLRSFKDGAGRHNGYLDDYAFFIAGLLDLYEATGDARWLREAIRLDGVLEKHYEDGAHGGFFLTSDYHEKLLTREKPAYDGAEPSGNSVAVMNLLRLHEFTTGDGYRQRADRLLQAFEKVLLASPAALSEMLPALDFRLDTPKEIIIVTPRRRFEAGPLLARLRRTFVPNRILTVLSETDARKQEGLIPLLGDKTAIKGRPTAYVCEQRVCDLPATDPAVFAEQILRTRPLPAAP